MQSPTAAQPWVLAKLGMIYRVEEQRADLLRLHLQNIKLQLSATGAPSLCRF